MKKTVAVVIMALMLFSMINPVSADRRTPYKPSEPEKHYSTVTIDDEFDDDVVYVTFNNATSRKLLEYSPEDFPEIECVEVFDTTLKGIKAILKGEEGYRPGEENYSDWVSIDEYHMTLRITLANPGKQNVLDAIHLLEKREDVLWAKVYRRGSSDNWAINSPFGESYRICGDVNMDGTVNARDVATLMKMICRGTSVDESSAGDINLDGKINARDVTELMHYIVAN